MTRWLSTRRPAFVACAFPLLVGCSPSATTPGAQAPGAQSIPGCTVRTDATRTTYSCSREQVIHGVDVKLTVDSVEQAAAATGSAQPAQASNATETETRFYANGQLVLDWVHESLAQAKGQSAPTLKDTYTYGPAVHGPRSVALTTSGGTVSGTIDGRALAPYKATSPPAAATFTDGTPAPPASIDPAVREAISAFVSQTLAAPSR